MRKEERARLLVERLGALYPEATCALEYGGEGWRLLVMGILSAQCTDRRVNAVCAQMFARYPTLAAFAAADLADIEGYVHPCGLYRTKAKNILACARLLLERHGGEVPSEMEALLALPGVGRKIANLLRGDLYHLPAIVADTHCIRLAARFGFVPKGSDPYKVEKALVAVIPPAEQSDFCHRLVLFGRDRCTARGPRCEGCPLWELCKTHG